MVKGAANLWSWTIVCARLSGQRGYFVRIIVVLVLGRDADVAVYCCVHDRLSVFEVLSGSIDRVLIIRLSPLYIARPQISSILLLQRRTTPTLR